MNHIMNVDSIIINGGRLIAGMFDRIYTIDHHIVMFRSTNWSIQWNGGYCYEQKFSDDHTITHSYTRHGTKNDWRHGWSRFTW